MPFFCLKYDDDVIFEIWNRLFDSGSVFSVLDLQGKGGVGMCVCRGVSWQLALAGVQEKELRSAISNGTCGHGLRPMAQPAVLLSLQETFSGGDPVWFPEPCFCEKQQDLSSLWPKCGLEPSMP